MRETSFIKQNKDKWSELEKVMDQESKDPEKLNELFIKVTDDLSYSRTYYSNRSVRVYLNGLAQRIFYSIYKNRKNRGARFKSFWTTELPQLVYESRVAFRISFGVFMLSMLIGAVSSMYDPDFLQAILGESYVDMTVENIDSGDPMAVYKAKGKLSMSVGITLNNIFVSFWTFIMGVVFLIGSLGILISNGIMVGAFQYFFYEQGLLKESALTIWTHGTLEISAIIIAGAAGITMGRGLVFPGTFSRINSFQLSARRGLKIMIGITPIFIVAGFIEGFVTRLTETPDIIRLLFILVCLAFIIGYFFWLPIKVGRNGIKLDSGIADLHPSTAEKIDLGEIKKSGALFADLINFLRAQFKYIFGITFCSAILFIGLCLLTGSQNPSAYFPYDETNGFKLLDHFFANEFIPLLPFINCLIFWVVSYFITQRIIKVLDSEKLNELEGSTSKKVAGGLKLLLICSLLSIGLYSAQAYTILLFILAAPIFYMWLYRSSLPGQNTFQDFRSSTKLGFSGYGAGIGMAAVITILSLFVIYAFTSNLFSFSIEVLTWNLPFDLETREEIVIVVFALLESFIILFTFSAYLIAASIQYYSLMEKTTAHQLKQKVANIGVKRTLQGLDQEKQVYGA